MSCAQVPKESVELSATVGRDLATVYKAHRELAQVLFARMRRDINRFVDDVYAPFQINRAMIRQGELANSSNREERNKSLLLAINAAFKPGASPQLQKDVLEAMGIMVRKIQNDIESMRKELLVPLEAQESEVLGSIDRSYQQLHYANSIVTGHLSSVAKVHETQAELLKAIGVERDLRKEVGRNIARASDEIADLVEAAESIEDNVNKAEKFAKDLKDTIDGLASKLKKKPEEG
jgi:hypothetical protein